MSCSLSEDQVKFIADRRFGVGCDQLLLVEKPSTNKAEFRYRIFNADGGEVEQCGNGARCFARFVVDKGLTHNQTIARLVNHPSTLSSNENTIVDYVVTCFVMIVRIHVH